MKQINLIIATVLLLSNSYLFAQTNIATQIQEKIKSPDVKFIENKGQLKDYDGNPVPNVYFKVQTPSVIMYITDKGITYQFFRAERIPLAEEELKALEEIKGDELGFKKTKKRIDWERIDMHLEGANIKEENIITELESDYFNNYIIGNNSAITTKEYGKITIKNVYPGIDWVFYNSNKGGVKYDFVVHPNAEISQIKLNYHSLNPIKLNQDNGLTVKSLYGELVEQKPFSYVKSTGKEIRSNYEIVNQQLVNNILDKTERFYTTTIQFQLSEKQFKEVIVIDPILNWSTFFGGSSITNGPMAIHTDNNNFYVVGYTDASLDFPLQDIGGYFQGTVNGSRDAFLSKFNNNGVLVWSTFFGGSSTDEVGVDVTTDNNGNIVVVGNTSSLDFPVLSSGGFFQGTFIGGSIFFGGDVFISKFDTNGILTWSTYFGGENADLIRSVNVDRFNNTYITGMTFSTALITQNSGNFFQGVNNGSFDMFIAKFDSGNNLVWSTYYGGGGPEQPGNIVTDTTGNVYIVGFSSSNNISTQNSGNFFQPVKAQGNDGLILKFNTNDSLLWATYYGGNGDEMLFGLEIDTTTGNIYVSGNTASSNLALQNSGGYFQPTRSGIQDAVVLKFNANDSLLWGTYFGGTGTESSGGINSISIDYSACQSSVYFSFETTSTNVPTAFCANDYIDQSFNSAGNSRDIFLSNFSSTDYFKWGTYFGGDGAEFRSSIATDINGNLFTTGEWQSVFNNLTYPLLNPGGGAYFDSTSNTSLDNGFLAKFIPQTLTSTLTTSTIDASCSGAGTATVMINGLCPPFDYIWSNGTQTIASTDTFNVITNLPAGIYNVTVRSGCDSLQTMVTINQNGSGSVNNVQNPIICQGQTFLLPGGITVSSSGTFIDTLVGAASNGCDSIITTNLTVNPTTTSIDTQTVCDSLTWIDGVTYTSSTNSPTFNIVGGASNGCDSIITLNLTINSFVTGTDVQTACNSLTWIDGVTYTTSTNTPTFNIVGGAVNGCDSIVTLNLTINTNQNGTDVQTACNSYTWIDGITYSLSTNTPTFTFVGGAVNGCDSVVTLDLTITVPTTTTNIFNECEGFSVAVGLNTYTTTGIFTDIINNCDTIITDLTINNNPQLTLIKTDDNCGEQLGSITAVASTNNPPITYNWSTGSSNSIISNLLAGVYSIVVTDNNNCSTTDSVLVFNITANCEQTIFIPNVFSPNGDNQNDLFMIQLIGLEFENLKIYNRWGILLFETNNINEGWDGTTTSGEDVSEGSYFFILSYKNNNEKQIKKGTLTLLK